MEYGDELEAQLGTKAHLSQEEIEEFKDKSWIKGEIDRRWSNRMYTKKLSLPSNEFVNNS